MEEAEHVELTSWFVKDVDTREGVVVVDRVRFSRVRTKLVDLVSGAHRWLSLRG